MNTFLGKNEERGNGVICSKTKKKQQSLSLLEVLNPLEESKVAPSNNKNKDPQPYDDSEELVDGDEGIINRRLPINSYNHQYNH